MKDSFDLYWEWANKVIDSQLMLDGRIYNAVTALSEQDRSDREKVNAAVARYQFQDEPR